jgi:hypothetical protein
MQRLRKVGENRGKYVFPPKMSELFGGRRILTVTSRRQIFFLNKASNVFFILKFAIDKKKLEKSAKKRKI